MVTPKTALEPTGRSALGWPRVFGLICVWARQSSAKLPRCGMMKLTVGFGEQFDGRDFAHDVIENWQVVSESDFANFAADPGIVAVDFDADKSVALDGILDEAGDAAEVSLGMNKGETVEAPGFGDDDTRDVAVGDGVVGMKRSEEHGAVDSFGAGAAQVGAERGVGIPRAGEAVPLSGMAVAIDDHDEVNGLCATSADGLLEPGSGWSAANAERGRLLSSQGSSAWAGVRPFGKAGSLLWAPACAGGSGGDGWRRAGRR
jgi:hypothetical protein